MPNSPNVLILMADQHRWDVTGYAGNEIVRTPNLDWLAETGTVFENAYTPSPVCVPARHSIRTGQLPRTWEQAGFNAFESQYRTLPRHLGQQGYMSASAGKMHYPGFAQMQGWRKRIGPTPMKRHIEDDVVNRETETNGSIFDNYPDGAWSFPKEIKRAGVGNSRVQVQDTRTVEGADQFLKQYFAAPYYDRCQPDRPLVFQLSLIQPHYPFFTESEDLFTYYLNRVEPFIETPTAWNPDLGYGNVVRPEEDVTKREIQRATAAYYAMVERVDTLFGRVLDSLRQYGEALDDWVIVFTSDHGEMLGQQGGWGKGNFYEPSVKVPLIVRYPAESGVNTVNANVNLCDLYATICEVTDSPTPPGLDSRSLLPLLQGDNEMWKEQYRNETVSQLAGNNSVVEGLDRDQIMIKRGDLKYCYYGREEHLFDLSRNPAETTNFITDPAYETEVHQFRDRRAELGFGPDANPEYATAGYN